MTRRVILALPLIVCLALVMFWPGRAPAQVTTGFTLLASTDATTTTYTDTTCAAGSTCSYEVTAFDAAGQSAPASVAAGITCAIAGVSCVSATPGPMGQVVLSWTPGTGGAAPTGYNVYTAARPPLAPTGLTVAGK